MRTKKNKDFTADSKASPEIYKKIHPVMLEVMSFIKKEKRKGKFLESVILSPFKYAQLESWLERVGIINEISNGAPLDWKGVEIKKSIGGHMFDITPEYKEVLTPDGKLVNLEMNAELFNITNGKILDEPFKKIKWDKSK